MAEATHCVLCRRTLPFDTATVREYRGTPVHQVCALEQHVEDLQRMVGELMNAVNPRSHVTPRPTPHYAPHSDVAEQFCADLEAAFAWEPAA